MPPAYAKVSFVDANPTISDVRAQELLRSQARSHAAHASHPSTRRPQFLPPSRLPGKRSSHKISSEAAEREEEQRLKGVFHTFQLEIPKHKGNSDPFNSTAVSYTPLEYSLVKWSRSMQIVTAWPSDVKIRQNMPQMLEDGRDALGNLVDNAATIHAFISYSCFQWYALSRQNQAPSHDPAVVTLAKKHSSLGLRNLHALVKGQTNSESRRGLENVRNAATWLGASELYAGKFNEAHVHYTAVMKLIRLMGGLKALPDFESGIMIHAVIGLAMIMRSRPLIEPEEFDPGPWCEQSFAAVITKSDAEFGEELVRSPSPPAPDASTPTTASSRQQLIFAEMRQILVVEEYKVKHALSKSKQAAQAFRWSHFRKLAVRSKNAHYWCDLVDEAKDLAPVDYESFSPKTGTLKDTFDMCLFHAVRCFDRCIFEEQYSPAGPFPLSKGNYMQLLKGLGEVRETSSKEAMAARKYDMLWISTTGAYFEDTFLEQRFAIGADPAPITYYFARQFTKLAEELEFYELDGLKKFLRERYVYCARLQDDTLRKLLPVKTPGSADTG